MYTIFRLLIIATIYGDKRMLGKQKTDVIKFKKSLSGWERKRREVVPLSNGAVHLYSVTVQVHAFILTNKQPVMSISVMLIYDKKKKKTVKSC